MKNLKIAFRSLFRKGRHNGMRILSLGVGLAVALILVAKIYFEQSYDRFYPDVDRIYRLVENFNMNDGETHEHGAVSGGVAPGMQAEVPGVEVATRLTYLEGGDVTFTTPDKIRYTAGNVMFGDTNVFKVLSRPVLFGVPENVLSHSGGAMISRSLAEKLGGIDQVNGLKLVLDKNSWAEINVEGVFEDIPENSHLRYDILVSIEGLPKWSRERWVGNDRYLTYVRLAPGVTPESLKPAIRDMFERHVDMEELKKAGIELEYGMKPLLEMHAKYESVGNLVKMLAILAFALLFTAVMNYILISISSIVNRAKEVAVRKSYGASERNIHSIVVSETLVHMFLALLLAVFLVFLGRDLIRQLLDVSAGTLLFSEGALLLLIICVLVFGATAYVPGLLFARIPVASVFRNFRESRRIWKLGLLFLQFVAVGLLVCLLLVVGRQYHFMMNDNPGYAYERLAYSDISAVDSTRRYKLVEEIQRLAPVEMVTTSYMLPIGPNFSGNNIQLPNDNRNLFNIIDQYYCGNGYLEMLAVPVIEGRSFTENVDNSEEIMVNRAFVEKMQQFADWSDGAVGKYIWVSEHSGNGSVEYFRICGVFENYRIGSLVDLDERPTVLFYRKRPSSILAVKFKTLTPETLMEVRSTLNTLVPDQDLQLDVYSALIEDVYSDARKFRDQVMIGGSITLIIALIGLIGYTNDEINRRRKELAIRKVNGAILKDILSLFLGDIMKIAIPAILIGSVGSYFVAEHWQQQFAAKIPLSWWLFLSGAALVVLVIIVCVVYRVCRAVNDDPVNSLKAE